MDDFNYSFFGNSNSILDTILKEAEDDEGSANDAGGEDTAAANDADSNGDGEVSDDEANDAAADEGDQADEDFNVDTDLPEDEGGDDTGDTDTTDDSGSSDIGSSSSPASDDEPKEANTSIFDSLTAEEQVIKIRELKNSYKNLYSSIDDNLNRINNMDIDEDTLDVMSRVTSTLYGLKDDVANYFINQFNLKGYLDNDTKYNEFLAILKAVTTVVDELASKKQEILGLNTTKTDKK